MTDLQQLPAQAVTPEAFEPYGQVIFATRDGKPFDPTDAQLELTHGIPRFYIMRLPYRSWQFHLITCHLRCTQCLGSLGDRLWWLAVAPPGKAPELKQIQAFWVPGTCFVKLHAGTWHTGPYFEGDTADFYNLELSDTNVTDHNTYDLLKAFGYKFEILK